MRGLMRPIGIAAAALVAVTGGALGGESLDGFWMDSHGEVILDIGKCGNARCGKVAWLQKPRGPDRGPLRDFRNSDPKLQARFVCGLPVVIGATLYLGVADAPLWPLSAPGGVEATP